MLKGLLYSSLVATALTASLAPSLAQAQPSCQEQKNNNRVLGTVLGAVGGALLGNAIGQGGGREGGTIIGGVGGAVAGNVVGGSTVNCGPSQYGYYDDNGRWIPNTVTEKGYYDANGHWVDTPAQPSYTAPPPPPTYGQEGGYAPPPPPPDGYGQDRPPGQDSGYAPPPPGDHDRYADQGRDPWAGAPTDTREREDWLQARIQHRIADGELDDRRGRHALRDLDDIRRIDADYRQGDGHLSPDQRRDIVARLDTLRASLWADRDQADAH
jgi:hypothetical protein